MTNQDRLIKFILDHDHAAVPHGDTELLVTAWAGMGDNWEQVSEVIPATASAVRLWLGY